MANDPAFLFYPGDWLGGTQLFSRSHKGAYMDLLMAQYANGHLPLSDIEGVLGSDFSTMWESKLKAKFTQDETGRFFNEKLEKVMASRKFFTESRINNLKGKGTHKVSHKATHTDNRMENEIENETIIKKRTEKQKKPKPEIKITLPAGWFDFQVMPLLEVWVKGRKKPTSNELIQIRVNELAAKYPMWHDAEPKMREAGLEGWLKFVYPESNKNVLQNGKEPKKSPATLSHELIRDKA